MPSGARLIDCASFAVDRNGEGFSKELFPRKGEPAEGGATEHRIRAGTRAPLTGKYPAKLW
jgi:hypothetical protein